MNDVVLIRLRDQLADAVLANFIDGEVAELIHCLPPLVPRSGLRLHLVDPSRQVNRTTQAHHVAEILRVGTDGVKDADEIAGGIIVWFVVFLVGNECCRV